MEYLPITRELLAQMNGILSLSAGYDVSIAGELEHFESERAKGWIAAKSSDGRLAGFVRHFFSR